MNAKQPILSVRGERTKKSFSDVGPTSLVCESSDTVSSDLYEPNLDNATLLHHLHLECVYHGPASTVHAHQRRIIGFKMAVSHSLAFRLGGPLSWDFDQ